MKKNLITLLVALLCGLVAEAQPLLRETPHRRRHHTHRLPGVNENRLARLEKMREANIALRHRQGPWRAQTQPQTKRGLVLLVNFSDVKMKSDAATQWNNRFNQKGFSLDSHIGSVRDYFIEQSYGLLTIDFDVIGPLELTKSHDYYGTAPNSDVDDRAPEMVIEALKLADPKVNYADYDWDGNGWVDQVYVIYAGKTSDTEPGYIWPHEWELYDANYYQCGSGVQYMDGVSINTYAVSNELASEKRLEGIGTACHEFSHCLGYPDFYDVDYTGGTAGQFWDLLDGGSYNGPMGIGEIPCPYTAYERWTAGWIDLIPLTEPGRIKDMPAINEEGVAYVINNTGNSNEYYILENRQQITFGTGNHGHGLMVWHIDYNRSAWNNNTVNRDKNHQRMTFLPADGQVGVLERTHYGYHYEISVEDEAGDPYPGIQNVNEVDSLTWFVAEKNGGKTHSNLIHNITETPDGKISFTYGKCYVLATPEVACPAVFSTGSFTANWKPVEGATSYNLEVKAITGEASTATILSEDFSGLANVGADAAIGSSIINKYTQTTGWTGTGLFGTNDASVRVSSSNVAGYLATPAFNNREGTLVVEFDAAYYNEDGSSVVVSVLNGNQTLATQTVQLTNRRATYTCTFEDVPSGCNVKFASTAKKKRFYLYNVNIMDMTGVGTKVSAYTGLTTTSYTITQVEADQYSYRVQAICEDGESEWSEWMDVDIASAIGEVPTNTALEDEMFSLQGQRMQHPPRHGFYIRNGKTYLVP